MCGAPEGARHSRKSFDMVSERYNVAYATVAAITFSAVASAPTPIYRLYRETMGLSPFMVTLVFAIYSLTMIGAFLTVARLSDFIGRKPMVLAALAANAVALVLFLVAETSGTLLAARAIQGVATGIGLATLGAYIADSAPELAPTLNSVTAYIGLMLGALASGACVAFLPAPTHLIYAILLAVVLIETAALFFARETVSRTPGGAGVFRPRLTVPARARGPMLRLFPLTLSAWGLGGFYLSLMPSLFVEATGVTSPLAGAAVVSSLMASGAVSTLAFRKLSGPVAVATASLVLALGVAAAVAAISAGSPAGMIAGTLVAGVGFGVSYGASLRVLLPLAANHERAGLLSAFFVASYTAFAIPAVVAGLAAPHFGLAPTALAYGVALAACALTTFGLQLVEMRAARRLNRS